MSEFVDPIKPDVAHQIEFGEENPLLVDGRFDTLHYFEPLEAWWLRYINPDSNNISMVVIPQNSAHMLVDGTDIPIVYRESIFESEHTVLVEVLGRFVSDASFDLSDIDEEAIIAEFENPDS